MCFFLRPISNSRYLREDLTKVAKEAFLQIHLHTTSTLQKMTKAIPPKSLPTSVPMTMAITETMPMTMDLTMTMTMALTMTMAFTMTMTMTITVIKTMTMPMTMTMTMTMTLTMTDFDYDYDYFRVKLDIISCKNNRVTLLGRLTCEM